MIRLSLVLLASILSLTAAGEEIPLKQIWALGMPGTHQIDISKSDGSYKSVEGRAADTIRKSSFLRPNRDDEIDACFVVAGKGIEAISNASKVILSKEKAARAFRSDGELSLFFFARRSGVFVHVTRAIVRDGVIHITYSLEPHSTRQVTEHFALIPLGTLKPGKYTVELSRDRKDTLTPPDGLSPVDGKLETYLICKQCEFLIEAK
jgi:hypothetical protein